MLRVTSGLVKGFKIEVPRAASVRPPLEMLREAVFNILGQDLAGWRVADLFAGSGVMGIEALSRGADWAVFIEKNRSAAAAIRRNLEKTRMTESAGVITGNAFSAPFHLEGRGPFDAAFLDPPFEMMRAAAGRERVVGLVEDLFACGELGRDALIILRVPREVSVVSSPGGAEIDDQRCYGHSRVVFFSRLAAPEAAAPSPDAPSARACPPSPPSDDETPPGQEA